MSVFETGFNFWLKNLCDSFAALTDPQKNMTIESIISMCGPEQLRFLSTKLETLVKRDFLKCLPPELSFRVLEWLDPTSLCKCCLVSKSWNKVIVSCCNVWQRACSRLGMKVEEEVKESSPCLSWKAIYVSAVQRRKRLKDRDSIEQKLFYGHTARVFALCYRGSYLATGSDDRSVRLWDLTTGQCKSILKTHTCADICFDDQKVITASFDNTVGMWDWKTGDNLQYYKGHTAAVFSVDYCDELDLIVSGSADSSLRIWKMSSGQCLQTRYGHMDWVIKVILRKVDVDSLTHRKNQYALLSMDKRTIKIWSLNHTNEKCLATLTPPDLNTNLQPRLQFDGHTIVCASETAILLWDFETLHMKRVFTASPARWLVAYGHVFSLLMDLNALHVVSTRTEDHVAEVALPPFRRSVRGSNFTPGETTWLDGPLTRPLERLLFATSMPDYSVLVFMLKEGT